MAKQKGNSTSEQASAQNRLNDELKKSVQTFKEINEINRDGLDSYFDRLDISKKLNEDAKILSSINDQIYKYSKSTSKNASELVGQYKMHKNLLSEVQSKYAEVVKNSKNIADASFEIVDLTDQMASLSEIQLELDESRGVIGDKEYDRQKKLLDIVSDRLEIVETINKQQLRGNELSQKFLGENRLIGKTLNKTLDGIESMVGKYSGDGIIGSLLGKKATALLDKTKEDIQSKIVTAFQTSGDAGVTAFSVTRMAAGSFIRYALPALGIAGMLGIFYAMIKAAGHLDEELKEIGHQFGVSRKEADAIHHLSIDIAKEMNLVGINSKEVADGLKQTSEIMGGLNLVPMLKDGNKAAMQLVKDVTILTEKLHMSADEAANIQNLSVITGKPIGQLVKESIKLGKGLFTAKDSMKIIGKISPAMALNFRKGSIEMLKTAQQAKLLGLELSDVQSFGKGILDFETSLQNEMQARVLTGKDINFDLARQYALNNDISGLQEVMLDQLGSLNEFEKMNYLQREAISDAFGMTVDQVAELLTNQEKLNDLGLSQENLTDLQASNAEKLRKEAEKTSNVKLKDYLTTLAKEKEVATINDRIADSVKKIKEVLASTLAPLLEQVHAFFDSAEGAEFIKSAVSGVKSLLTGIVSVVKFIASGITGINKLFGGTGVAAAGLLGIIGTIATYFVGKALIVNGVKSLISGLGAAKNAAAGLSSTMQSISGATGSIGGSAGAGGQLASAGAGFSTFAQNAIGIAAVLIAFAGALWITSKAFENFAKLDWDEVLGGIGVMAALLGVAKVLVVLGKVVTADGGATAIGLIALGASLVLFSSSLLIAAKGLEIMSKVKWKGFEGMFTALVKVAASFAMLGAFQPLIYAGSLALGAAGLAVGVFASSVYLLGKGLKSLSEIGDMKSAGRNILNGFKELGKIPKSIKLGDLEDSFDELEDILAELDFDDLLAFSEISKTDMKNAGKNLKEGIESLATIGTGIDLGSTSTLGFGGSGVALALEKFNDAIGALELDGIQAIVEVAKTDLSNVGKNLQTGINSLSSINVDRGVFTMLSNVGGVFESFEDAISELDFEKINELTGVSVDGMITFAEKFNTFVVKLNQSSSVGKTALSQTKSNLATLNEIIDKMSDMQDKLEGMGGTTGFVSSIVGGVKKVLDFFETQATVNVEATGKTATGTVAGESEQSKTNKKLDQLVNLMGQMVNASNQPSYTVVKFGDRTIETIATQIERLKQQNPTTTGTKTIVPRLSG